MGTVIRFCDVATEREREREREREKLRGTIEPRRKLRQIRNNVTVLAERAGRDIFA